MNNSPEEEKDYFIWEEYDYESNRLYYESHLQHLEELPTREKHKPVKSKDD